MYARLIVRAAAAALVLTALSAPATAHGNGSGRFLAPNALVGSWRVTITPYNCQTLDEFPQFAFQSMLSFSAGGTLHETTSNANFAPGQRSAGFGYWERTGPNFYHAVVEAYIQFTLDQPPPPPRPYYQRGRQILTQGIEMVDRGRWTSLATVEFFDLSGTPTTSAGCAKAVGTRMP
jgi:hypothetical protein